MKTDMFRSLILYLLLLVSPGAGRTYAETRETPTAGSAGAPADEATMRRIAEFFAGRLGGGADDYDSPAVLRAAEVETCAARIWDAWKRANDRFAEEKLIPLGPLGPNSVSRWNLPADLEPDAVMPYYWGTKGEKRPDAGYPLFLYIHGSGDKEREWATGLSICSRFDDAPSAYFIPQIPNTGEYYRWWQRAKQFAWEKLLRQAFVSGEVDPCRIYIFGISEGGYGSQRLASFYADYLAGAGPMAGGEPLRNAPVENCAGIAFSFLTGAEDTGFYRNTLTTRTKEAFDRLESEHPGLYVHRIELIPGRGHSIDYTPTTPWLKQFARNPYPHYVNWEDFEMDGRHRNGFYNLYVRERPAAADGARCRYEMTVTGNDIVLNVDEVRYTTTERDPKWGIEMRFEKSYTPATSGRVIVYLCDELVDLDREVSLTVNGREVFRGIPELKLKHLVNSCAAFFDPARLYPAAIEADLSAR